MGRLLQAAATTRPNSGGVKSVVDVFLETLDGEDLEDARTILHDPANFGPSFVSKLILQVHGVRIASDSVTKWRRRNLGQAR